MNIKNIIFHISLTGIIGIFSIYILHDSVHEFTDNDTSRKLTIDRRITYTQYNLDSKEPPLVHCSSINPFGPLSTPKVCDTSLNYNLSQTTNRLSAYEEKSHHDMYDFFEKYSDELTAGKAMAAVSIYETDYWSSAIIYAENCGDDYINLDNELQTMDLACNVLIKYRYILASVLNRNEAIKPILDDYKHSRRVALSSPHFE